MSSTVPSNGIASGSVPSKDLRRQSADEYLDAFRKNFRMAHSRDPDIQTEEALVQVAEFCAVLAESHMTPSERAEKR